MDYAEQFWGFDEDRKRENGTIHTPSFLKRLELFTASHEVCPSVWWLPLCEFYSGVLFCQYDASGIHEA